MRNRNDILYPAYMDCKMRKPLLSEELAGLLLVTGIVALIGVSYTIPIVYLYYSDLADLWKEVNPVVERLGQFLVLSASASSAFLTFAYARFVNEDRGQGIRTGLVITGLIGPAGAVSAAILIYCHLPQAERVSMFWSSSLSLAAVICYCGLVILLALRPLPRRRPLLLRDQ